MIVLVEGLNCTGKTTLAQKFQEHLKLPIVKFDVPGPHPFTEFTERLNLALQEHRHFIIDRLHLSNYAYNGCLGGGVLDIYQWDKIDRMIEEAQGVLYWMVDTPHAIEARLKERSGRQDGAETMDRRQIGAIMQRFDQAYTQSQIRNKGSYTLPQFYDDGYATKQLRDHVLLLKGIMAGVCF
jgi:thymidylate kinase